MAAIRQPNFDHPLLPNPPLTTIVNPPEGYVPPEETRRHLSTALDICDQLKPIDNAISILYKAYTRSELSENSITHIGKLFFRIYETLQHERRYIIFLVQHYSIFMLE